MSSTYKTYAKGKIEETSLEEILKEGYVLPEKYHKILKLPHHVSRNHPQMPMHKRAAQFAPFAALSGYSEAIKESARLTEEQKELSEEDIKRLEMTMSCLLKHLPEHPKVTITYFIPDPFKKGGKYITVEGRIRKLDEYSKILILEDGTKIKLSTIKDMKSPLCEWMEE